MSLLVDLQGRSRCERVVSKRIFKDGQIIDEAIFARAGEA